MNAAPILTITRDGEPVRSHSVEGEISIGRAEGNVIRLEDRAISRHHAVLRALAEGLQIEKRSDFGAISVNGAECTRAVVKAGDVISIGPYLIRLEAGRKIAEPTPAATPIATLVAAVPIPSLEDLPMPKPSLRPSSDPTVVLPSGDSSDEPLSFNSEGATEVALASPIAAPIEADTVAVDSAFDMQNIFNTPPGDDQGHAGGPMEIAMDGAEAYSSPGDTESTAVPHSENTFDDQAKTQVQSVPVDAKIILLSGDASPAEFSIAQTEVAIGRGKNCDVVINDKKSSRRNTLIVKEGVRYFIRDLGSSNGTFVNDRSIKEKVLSAGDRIRIGECEFQFMAVNPLFDGQARDFMSVPEAPEGSATLSRPLAADVHEANTFGRIPGVSSIPAHEGAPQNQAPERKGLGKIYDKYVRNFTTLKPVQQILVVLVFILVALLFLEEDPEDLTAARSADKASAQAGKQNAAAGKGLRGMANLTPEQKQFVDTQYNLGFEFYTKKDYDKALYEVQKVFPLVPEHERAKELERYILEAKRMRDAIEAERKKKEEEARLKARIVSLKAEISGLMEKGDYAEAKERFADILEIDPEDPEVGEWRTRIDAFFEEQARIEQEKRVQEEINNAAQDTFKEADALQKAGKFQPAIRTYERVAEMGASDRQLLAKARARIQSCLDAIRERREPALARAREMEKEGRLSEAFREFDSASRHDPSHPEAYAGMDRIRGVLHEQARALYTEAVIAESYSDFKLAYRKFKEILAMAPTGSLYFDRATRKIANYSHFRPEAEPETQ